MSQPGRGPATSLPSLRLLRMTAFGTSRCRPPRCHVAAVSSDRGKNHDPAGTEAASHWSVTPCSPPSRPGRCAVGAGAPSLDRRCARCPGDGWPGQENGASTEQKNRGQAKKSLQSGRRLKNNRKRKHHRCVVSRLRPAGVRLQPAGRLVQVLGQFCVRALS